MMTGHRGRHDLRGAYTCKAAIEAEKADAEFFRNWKHSVTV